MCPLCYWQLWSNQQCNFHAQLSRLANIGRKTSPIPPCCDVPHTSQPGGYPLAVLSHQNFILHKGSQLPTLYRFVRIMSMPLLFFPALVKTGITLPLIQLMHHPLTSLPGSWGMTMPRYLLSFLFLFLIFSFYFMLCFVSSSHPRH